MGIVPTTRTAKLAFFKNKKEVWTGEESTIGLLPADTTQLGVVNDLADAAYANHVAAQAAAKTATAAWNTAIGNVATFGSSLITKIKGKAQSAGSGADAVYEAAQIPPPATPSTLPPPGTPTDFKATLQPSGAVKLSFKCNNPTGGTGVTYVVRRRVAGGATWEYLGTVGRKSITDGTVPSGVASVTYEITAIRSTSIGVAAEFNVNFGVSGSGEMFATIGPAPKMAA